MNSGRLTYNIGPKMLALVAVLMLLVACGGSDHLARAMTAFDKGVEAEHRTFARRVTSPGGAGRNPPIGSALAEAVHFREALSHLQKIDEGDESFLREANALGLKRAVHAQVLWKLGRYVAAREMAEDATKLGTGGLGTRDAFVVKALPALILNDQAYRMIHFDAAGSTPAATSERLKEVTGLLTEAIEKFDSLRRAETRDAPALELAAIRWLLIAYENFGNARDRMSNGTSKSLEDGPGPKCMAYKAQRALHDMVARLRASKGTIFASDGVLAPTDMTVQDGEGELAYWETETEIVTYTDEFQQKVCTRKIASG